MKIAVKKLWKGQFASVKSYDVEEAIRKRQSLVIDYYGKLMTVPWSDLKTRGKITLRGIESKINPGQTYDLVDYEFKPDKNNNLSLAI